MSNKPDTWLEPQEGLSELVAYDFWKDGPPPHGCMGCSEEPTQPATPEGFLLTLGDPVGAYVPIAEPVSLAEAVSDPILRADPSKFEKAVASRIGRNRPVDPDWVMFPVAEHCQFICYAQDEEWNLQRKRMVSASEVNALFGGKWTTESQLLERKLNTELHEKKDTRPMWWGRQLERANMEAFSEALGAVVYPMNALFKHRDYRIGATVDGFIEAWPGEATHGFNPTSSKSHWARFLEDFSQVEGIGLIEMKNTNTFKAKEWSARPPLEAWTQVQCQMFVTGLTWAVVCAKIGSDDMRAYLVRYDADWALTMRDRVLTFIGEWEALEGSK